MLKQRIITALILLLLFLSALYLLPAAGWKALTLAAILVGAWEWAGIAGFTGKRRWIYLLSTLLLALGLTAAGEGAGGPLLTAAALFWLLPAWLWLKRHWRERYPVVMAGVGWLLLLSTWQALVVLREMNPHWLLALMMVVWTADVAAYFVGRRFGKHKLAPAISPGKTWEGVAGALAGVTLLGGVVALSAPLSWWVVPAFWLLAGLSIGGDLFESWMKRVAGIKDSGTLLPGHGGVLDRIDGLIPVLPVAALCVTFVEWGVGAR
jgi:phosphatidate cytidylyltransferase